MNNWFEDEADTFEVEGC